MKINLFADIPCTVFLSGTQYVTPITLDVDDGRVQMSVLPSYPERFSSYTVIAEIRGDKLINLSGGASAVCWGEGLCDVTLSPPMILTHYTPEPLIQKRLSHDLITLYDDGRKKLMLEGTSFYNFDLPEGLIEESIRVKDLPHGSIVSVAGKVDDKEYLLALHSNGDSWNLMHEITADTITTTQTGVKTSTVIPCMLRYEKREFYKPFKSEPEECSYIPTIRHTYPDELVPYLFLEDVFLKNPNCLTYLDESISLNLEGLEEFFAPSDTVTHPGFDSYGLDVVAVYNSKERISHPDLYKFVVENGKIVNIIHLLTCN